MRITGSIRALQKLSSKPRAPMIKFPPRQRALPLYNVDQTPHTGAQRSALPSAADAPRRKRAKYEDVQLSNIRRSIAERLAESKRTNPHYYLTSEIVVDDLLRVCEELNATVYKTLESDEESQRLSITDFIIKASAVACQRVPEANSYFMDTFIRQNNAAAISMVVSTEAGVFTPIIFDAHTKDLLTISKETSELAKRAREGKLEPHESEVKAARLFAELHCFRLQGGSFTVSNLNMFGSVDHSADLQSEARKSALCQQKTGEAPILLEPLGTRLHSFRSSIETTIKVTLSCDHRVVDGAVGALWLKQFKSYLEKPHSLLL